MKNSTIITVLITLIGAVTLCFAQQPQQQQPQQPQQRGSGDWSQGFPEDPARRAAPAPAPPPAAPPPPPSLPSIAAPPPAASPAPAVPVPTAAQALLPPADSSAQRAGGAGEAVVPSSGIIDAESTQRLGTELSAGALACAPYLYFNYGARPGEGKVLKPKDRDMYQRFDRVHVKPTGKVDLAFKVGDTVDVLRSFRRIKIDGYAGRVVARTGRGVVVGFAGRKAVVELTDLWGKVLGTERIAKAEVFAPVYSDHIPAQNNPLKATVVMHLDNTITPYMHQYLVVDKGSFDGVKVGDFFRVVDRERPKRLAEGLVEAQAVSVATKASVLVIQKIYKERLSVGDEAFLSFRAAAK